MTRRGKKLIDSLKVSDIRNVPDIIYIQEYKPMRKNKEHIYRINVSYLKGEFQVQIAYYRLNKLEK